MKQKFDNFLFFAGLALVLYLIVNVVHLIWYIADPEGFWGFAYFTELLRVGFLVIVILLFALFLIFVLFGMLISSFKNGFKKEDFFKLLGMLVCVLILPFVNYLFANGISLYITKQLADKYEHLERTEDYISQGEILKACQYAEQAFKKEINRTRVPSFFFLSRLYSNTSFDKAQRLTTRYGAFISYAHCLKNSGSSGEAEELYKEAIILSNSDLLQEQKASFLSFPLLALAELNLQKGEYYKAEEYFEELEDVHEGLAADDIIYQIQGRMLFSDRALRVGDFSKSARINMEILKLYEDSGLNTDSRYYLGLLLVAAITEMHMNRFGSVQDLLIRGQSIADDKKDTPLYSNFLIVKGNFLTWAAENDYDASVLIQRSWWDNIRTVFEEKKTLKLQLLQEAEKSYSTALDVVIDKAGKDSYQYISVLRQLGNFYYQLGDNEKAGELLGEAQTILNPVRSENKDLYNDVMLSSLASRKAIEEELLNEIENQIFDQVTSNYIFLTEEEKESFVSKTEKRISFLNSYYVRENGPESARRLYNNILATKQLALNSNQHLRRYISGAPKNIQAEYHQLLKNKEEILYTTNEEKLTSLGSEITKQERVLKSKLVTMNSFSSFEPRGVTWEQVRDNLEPTEVAIEIINLPLKLSREEGEEVNYFALLLKKESEYPKLIHLFREKDLEDFMNKEGNVQERMDVMYGSQKIELLDIIWQPLSHELEDSSNIYLSVSGLLHMVSFPALMLDQPFEMHLLGSTRDLITPNPAERQEKMNRIALFGDVAFGSINESDVRSFSSVDNQIKKGLESGLFNDLQYTRQEVDTIEKIFNSANGMVSKWIGKKASEKMFRDLNKDNYNIIHLATHGFYFKKNSPGFSSTLAVLNHNFLEDNSMFRSGILLSRDDVHGAGKNNDGILTAFELSKMDFSGVDLMVLSACETARGDISGGEGVFGLQRALKLAGVKDQIVSLWQVPDKETSILFKIFYQNLIAGNSPYKSLNIAQREMARKYSPFYWAGFVLLE